MAITVRQTAEEQSAACAMTKLVLLGFAALTFTILAGVINGLGVLLAVYVGLLLLRAAFHAIAD
jgi:hypothetical protein